MDRRSFLFSGFGFCGLCMACTPNPAKRSLEGSGYKGRRLIIIELSGGNDGLNTLIPYRNETYFTLRPTLAISPNQTNKLTDQLGLHPNLKHFAKLYETGDLAVIQGLGYPSPGHSHFKSTALWHTGGDGNQRRNEGWIARAAQIHCPNAAAHGISFSDDLGILSHKKGIFISAHDTDQLRHMKLTTEIVGVHENPAISLIEKRLTSLKKSLTLLQKHLSDHAVSPDIDGRTLGRQLTEVVKVIQSDAPVPVFVTQLSGFDTHEGQKYRHQKKMRELDKSIGSTVAELKRSGHWEDTLIMTTSEFGRRPLENRSRGTDHGTAAPHFLIGGKIKGGIWGDFVDLASLDRNGDLKHTMDYRAVYDVVIKNWFHVNSRFSDFRDRRLQNLIS